MRLCETHMEKMCRMTLVTDKQPVDPKLEALYRQSAAANKAHSAKGLKLQDFFEEFLNAPLHYQVSNNF